MRSAESIARNRECLGFSLHLFHTPHSSLRTHNLHPHTAFARAVVFAKEHGLPATQLQLAVFDGQSLTASGHQGFDVRVGVALGVLVIALARHELFQVFQYIARNVGVETFLNGDARRRVRRANQTQPALDAALRHQLLNLRRNVHHLARRRGRKPKRVHCQNILPAPERAGSYALHALERGIAHKWAKRRLHIREVWGESAFDPRLNPRNRGLFLREN